MVKEPKLGEKNFKDLLSQRREELNKQINQLNHILEAKNQTEQKIMILRGMILQLEELNESK